MFVRHVLHAALASSMGLAGLAPATTPGGANQAVAVDQGPNWTPATRPVLQPDQGSQIMPLVWFEALKQPNGQPFIGNSLSRYGYLPNPASPTPGLPVGFTVNGSGNGTMVGMTCAACHTRQIVVGRRRLPDRRRPGDRRLPELPRGPRHRRRHGAEQRCRVHGLRRRRARPVAAAGRSRRR